ncbi:MAG TPA: PQQ-binding-like beta-propeller repeat protein [Acidimicrobiales bacterium]|nr:PQQ-binding-like beta-propeller repeat protein [Acidimicrobiales bacterium]
MPDAAKDAPRLPHVPVAAPRRRVPVPSRSVWLSLSVGVVIVVSLATAAGAKTPTKKQWPSGGQNLSDTHANAFETHIKANNVGSLGVKWTSTTTGDVSATPAIVNGVAYFPDWGGNLNAVNAATGATVWKEPVSNYDGIANSVSRTSPAVSGGVVYVGDQNGAHLMAIKAGTGALIWRTQLDTHPSAIITQSPLVDKGVVYVGVSSSEEYAASLPGYACCTFRGSMTAVKAKTGRMIWKTFMVPDNGGVPGGYSGAAIWSSTPAFDPKSKTLFVTTGNNYSIPAGATTCQTNGGTPDQCLAAGDHIDSLVALDSVTGAIRWAKGQGGFDTWTVACKSGGGPNCPTNVGADADFGSGAQLFTITGAGGASELVVGAGEKSGVYWEADAATGDILWGTQVGPGGPQGGIQWGTATDGSRIYVAEADSNMVSYTPAGSSSPTSAGSWAALDPVTGAILWQTADPSAGVDIGSVSAANGVVYAGSSSGHMYAMNAVTGGILWDQLGQGSSVAGPAIVNGVVYWGNGYARLGPPWGKRSTVFYAFALP